MSQWSSHGEKYHMNVGYGNLLKMMHSCQCCACLLTCQIDYDRVLKILLPSPCALFMKILSQFGEVHIEIRKNILNLKHKETWILRGSPVRLHLMVARESEMQCSKERTKIHVPLHVPNPKIPKIAFHMKKTSVVSQESSTFSDINSQRKASQKPSLLH